MQRGINLSTNRQGDTNNNNYNKNFLEIKHTLLLIKQSYQNNSSVQPQQKTPPGGDFLFISTYLKSPQATYTPDSSADLWTLIDNGRLLSNSSIVVLMIVSEYPLTGEFKGYFTPPIATQLFM